MRKGHISSTLASEVIGKLGKSEFGKQRKGDFYEWKVSLVCNGLRKMLWSFKWL